MANVDLLRAELFETLAKFVAGRVDISDLRHCLSREFFSDAVELPMDREVLGEMEIALAEYEDGSITRDNVLTIASGLVAGIYERLPIKLSFSSALASDTAYSIITQTETGTDLNTAIPPLVASC